MSINILTNLMNIRKTVKDMNMRNDKDENLYCSKCKVSTKHSKRRDEKGETQYVCTICGIIGYKRHSQRIQRPDDFS
jgi:uncharacterized paraquat-inducible protein A